MFWIKKKKLEKCEICEKISNNNIKFKIAENNFSLAFLSTDPISNGNAIIVTKKHYSNLRNCEDLDLKSLFSLSKYCGDKIVSSIKDIKDFYLIFNEGYIAGQKYNHFYFNLIPIYSKENGLIINKNIIITNDIVNTFSKLNKK